MKNKLKDGLQVFVALLFTGSTAFAMQPPAPTTMPQSTETAVVQEQASQKKAKKPQEKPAKASKPKKAVTWQDNPQNCSDDEWIAKEKPFKCIPKPKQETKKTSPSVGAVVTKSQPAFVPSGNKQAWLQASGIPANEWWAVEFIVSRESGWNPCAYYPGQSDCNANPVNACGLVQQNPCHKIPGDWRDPVAALKWQYQYVKGRYGGYSQAVAYWKIHHHY